MCSSIHGIFQTRVMEWVVISFSRGSSRPRNRAQVSLIAGRRFTLSTTREAPASLSISEMEAKTKGDIKKITDVGKEVEKWNFCALLVGMENGIAIIEQFVSPSKIIENIRFRNHYFEFMLKGNKMLMSRRYLQSHIHCYIVWNNQDRKTAQSPWADKWKKKMWHKHTLECASVFENEGYLIICSNMNEAGGYW